MPERGAIANWGDPRMFRLNRNRISPIRSVQRETKEVSMKQLKLFSQVSRRLRPACRESADARSRASQIAPPPPSRLQLDSCHAASFGWAGASQTVNGVATGLARAGPHVHSEGALSSDSLGGDYQVANVGLGMRELPRHEYRGLVPHPTSRVDCGRDSMAFERDGRLGYAMHPQSLGM